MYGTLDPLLALHGRNLGIGQEDIDIPSPQHVNECLGDALGVATRDAIGCGVFPDQGGDLPNAQLGPLFRGGSRAPENDATRYR